MSYKDAQFESTSRADGATLRRQRLKSMLLFIEEAHVAKSQAIEAFMIGRWGVTGKLAQAYLAEMFRYGFVDMVEGEDERGQPASGYRVTSLSREFFK